MRERARLEVFKNTPASRSRINRAQTLGQWRYRAGPPKGEHSGTLEKRLNRAAELRPELDLTCNRTLGNLRGQPGIKDELVGYLHGLAHTFKVAFCYRNAK
jgi:hypothetical protein